MQIFGYIKNWKNFKKVIEILKLNLKEEVPIYIGESNRLHIFEKHTADFINFSVFISDIIKNPDFVGINPRDNSLEYVKEFKIDNKFVKVAVRVSGKGNYFVKTMYSIPEYKVKNFLKIKRLKKVD